MSAIDTTNANADAAADECVATAAHAPVPGIELVPGDQPNLDAAAMDETSLRRDFLLDGDPAPVYRLGVDPVPGAPLSCAVAIGAFDGVHLGHRHLIDRTVADARAHGLAAVVVTFDPDPDTVVAPKPASKLLAVPDRLRALACTGVDAVLVVPFTRELAARDHVAFFQEVLAPVLDIRAVHVGAGFRLGAGGASTVQVIRDWGERRGIEVTGHRLLLEDGTPVSATRIRGLVGAGELDAAARQLGRRYFVRGTVVHGRGEGSKLGFPTANVERRGRMQMPRDGVYAGWALTDEGIAYPTAVNVGLPPMFADDPDSSSLEATLLGFTGDLYGHGLAVLLTKLLRPPVHFGSLAELVSAVEGNMDETRQLYGECGIPLK